MPIRYNNVMKYGGGVWKMRKCYAVVGLTVITLLLFPQFLIMSAGSVTSTVPVERKTSRIYPTEVVSERVVETRVEDGEPSTLYEVTLRISKETTIKMIEEDWETYEYTAYASGREAADRQLRERLESALNGPAYREVKVMGVKHGEGCITYAYALYNPDTGDPQDPVNLVFYGDGLASIVRLHMLTNLDNEWVDALGSTLITYINEQPHGGDPWYAESQAYQLDYPEGQFFGERYHIRIYVGGNDPHGLFGDWSVEGVHHEVWDWDIWNHVINMGWEYAEAFVRNDFADESFYAGVEYHYENNEGDWQGYSNNGYSSRIHLEW